MELKDIDRLETRLLAINLRLVELDHEMRQTQIRVHQLEAELEDARLAQMMGESAGNPAELGPALEQSRGCLESQREMIDRVRKHQWKVRVQHTLARVRQRRAEKQRKDGGDVAS